MPIETILALALTTLFCAMGLFAAVSGPLERRRRPRRASAEVTDGVPTMRLSEAQPRDDDRSGGVGLDELHDADLRPAALERVIRVGTWVFLFTATVIVWASGLWADRQALILALLGLAAVFALVVHGVRPARVPDAALLAVEGALGLVFASLLVALTGGAVSPFTPVLALLVVAAAIVVSPRVTLALTAAAGLAYVAAVLIGGPDPLTTLAVAVVGVNLTVLCLVAYVGTAIGREQRRAREEAIRRSTVDDLTGLRNRRYLFWALDREISRSERTGRAFCLLMIDLDNLKIVNDRHGHLAGDAVLRLVGDVIQAGIRRIDTGARFGGDEFVVLLPETDPTGGWILAEKIRQGLADATLSVGGEAIPVSVSVGLVACPQDGATVGELLGRADDAMYEAKRRGRDRTTAMATGSAGAGGEPV